MYHTVIMARPTVGGARPATTSKKASTGRGSGSRSGGEESRNLFLDGVLIEESLGLTGGSQAPKLEVVWMDANSGVKVKASNPGGGASCAVDSVTFVYGPSRHVSDNMTVATDVAEKGVVILFTVGGYYSIFAYGNCEGGAEETAISVGMSVFSGLSPAGPATANVAYGTLFSIRYTDFTPSSFTPKDEKQVCDNVLVVRPGGQCRILKVLPGSVVVSGTVTYPSAVQAVELADQLTFPTTETMYTLALNLTRNTSAAVEASESGEIPEEPSVPEAPTSVMAFPADQGCPRWASLVVKWMPIVPSDIVQYSVTCVSKGGNNSTVIVGSASGSAVVGNLQEKVVYSCFVISLTLDQVSDPSEAYAVTTEYVCGVY